MLSYDVERWFYHHLADRLPSHVKLARAYPLPEDQEHNLLLEDLSVDFPFPASGSLGKDATLCVLDWLAGFHGTYFGIHNRDKKLLSLIPPPSSWSEGATTSGIWQRGTYYYLDTRKEELDKVDEEEYAWLLPWVEKVNDAIDREIKRFGTIIHGDVKGANIVFSRNPFPPRRKGKASKDVADSSQPLQCALYDLQYVGLGLPTLDLVYFFGTSVESSLLSPSTEKELLQAYHASLSRYLSTPDRAAYTFDVFWHHWELAIVDWYRFMAGWGFWGNDSWVERRAREVVSKWRMRNTEQIEAADL
ncbi:hypothetical protein NM688_g7717 [Phlebia brevispora]|uniref:Uncharacterized protein n=1 Tax=Phlebia brevispora TaxID=194682 RepID=A0ACC1S1X3_9APHY|nr:hypothetical protein NM688_g7717 [Phlebia brevispora]